MFSSVVSKQACYQEISWLSALEIFHFKVQTSHGRRSSWNCWENMETMFCSSRMNVTAAQLKTSSHGKFNQNQDNNMEYFTPTAEHYRVQHIQTHMHVLNGCFDCGTLRGCTVKVPPMNSFSFQSQSAFVSVSLWGESTVYIQYLCLTLCMDYAILITFKTAFFVFFCCLIYYDISFFTGAEVVTSDGNVSLKVGQSASLVQTELFK